MILQGLRNFRDMGGVAVQDGRKVRSGLIYRSDSLHKLTAQDLSLLRDQYKVHTVIDLRTNQEVLEKPNVSLEGIECLHIPIFKEAVIGITKETGADTGAYIKKTWNRKAIRAALPDMMGIYSYVLSDPEIVAQIRTVMHKVIENAIDGKATLFHCSVGKDRTGSIAALLLAVLGADRETIFADYASCSHVFRAKALKDAILVTLFKFDPIAAAIIYRSYMADPEYIKASFDCIDRLYGSSDGFIRDTLEITDELREEFKNSMLIC